MIKELDNYARLLPFVRYSVQSGLLTSVDEHKVQSLHTSNIKHSFPWPVANVPHVTDPVQSVAQVTRVAGPRAVDFVQEELYTEFSCSYSRSITVVPEGNINVKTITVTIQKRNMFDSDSLLTLLDNWWHSK